MGALENEHIYGVRLRESANDGSDFSNPDADYRIVFLGEDGQLHAKDSAGTVTDIGASSGAVATDAIWDAAGDLAVGSGANTAAKLAIGATNGMAVRRVSGAVAWDLPPGHEFNYVEKTSSTNITATSFASADTIITAGSVTYDGSTIILIEFYAVAAQAGTTSISINLWDGSTDLGRIAYQDPSSEFAPVHAVRRLTPSAAAHTYSIRAIVGGGTGQVPAGAGGAGTNMPCFIRQTKV